MIRKFKIKREEPEPIKTNATWKVERDGVVFILSTQDIVVGDYFVFTAPNNPNIILGHDEMFNFNTIRHAKVLWCYNKIGKDLDGILYQAKDTSGI